MKAYNFIIKHRLLISIILILTGVYVNYAGSFWPAFPLYLVGVILLFSHFSLAPCA